ncbi:MAG: hypothetical protein V4555_19915, partial [Acidobacteriota bacterium]
MSGNWYRFRLRWMGVASVVLGAAAMVSAAGAQTCTTQAKLAADVRDSLTDATLTLATAVQGNQADKIQAMTVPDVAASFQATAYLIRTTSEKIAGDSLEATQLYVLDASNRQPGDSSEANFSCALAGSTDETDFAIPALPQGRFAFAMVEAKGNRPWLLAFVLQQQGREWKLAGFSSHARTAAGHDGVWYWTAGREAAAAKQLWRAWVLFGQAGALLRPASFVDTSHFDKLQTERNTAAPPEL